MKELILFENDKIYARITSSITCGRNHRKRVEYTVSWKPKVLLSGWIPSLTTTYQKTAYKRFHNLTKASMELTFVNNETWTDNKEMTLL